MRLPFEGVGGVAAPTPPGPIGRIMQRVLTLRDVSPSPEVLRAAEALTRVRKAEEAARQGISGEVLDRLILYLSNTTDRSAEVADVIGRVRQLQPAVSDAGYC
jgi:hypothetical protein